MSNRTQTRVRRGMSTVETSVLILLVVCAAAITVGQLGSKARNELNSTAKEIKQNKGFFKRFTTEVHESSDSELESESESEEGYEYEYVKLKGNNGVGNGEDPQPPGNPPVNDGPGTSPGDPGNRGGAHK